MRVHGLPIAAIALSVRLASALQLSVNSTNSIQNASATLAFGLMSWYQNNQTSTPLVNVGVFPAPYYWWEAGAVWGGMIDYWAYTNDTSYNPTVMQALLAQVGPNKDYMMPAYYTSLGNDDQAFWILAALAAAEYGLPTPSDNSSTVWLDLAEAGWNSQAPRWDTTSCNGGLKWQIFQSNAGYDYKNSISNGGFFQISARLARYTGNSTYLTWAERAWDWMEAVNLIDNQYNVFDGTDDTINCSQVDHTAWTYNPAMLLYGTAMLYNYTNGSQLWENRTTGLLENVANTFFSPYPNATDIMYEPACEPSNACDNDQYSFKAYLSRWMAKAAIVAPYIASPVTTLLTRSAQAVAQACSGGVNSTTCGAKWYVGGYDGAYGPGQELSALETVQALLLLRGDGNVTTRYPMTAGDVHVAVALPSSTLSIPPKTSATSRGTSVASATSTPRSADASLGSRPCRQGGVGVWAVAAFASVVLGAFFLR